MEQLVEFIGNHPFLVGMFALLLAFVIRNESARGGKSVTVQELVNLVNREGAVIVDVRDAKEYGEGHIVDAINIPHGAMESRYTELDKYKEKPLVLACRMGQHSGVAGTVLRKHGFGNVLRLRGGMAEWRNSNLPVVKGRA